MAIVFLTGLSGVGTTSVLKALAREGFSVVDTDYGYIKTLEVDGRLERLWDEIKIQQLIENHQNTDLFLSGCYDNQGKFYREFDSVVLLKAERDVMLKRVANRTSNPYGKSPEERAEIISNYETVLPLLERTSDLIIDTTFITVEEVCNQLKQLV